MKNFLRSSVFTAALVGAALLPCAGQQSGVQASETQGGTIDLALTYTAKVAKISNLSNSNFVLNGGAAEGLYWLGPKAKGKDLGIAVEFSGERANNIRSNVDLTQFSLVAGPRLTLWKQKSAKPGANLYGQALFGFVHASDSVFPVLPSSVNTSATSFAFQTGGGLNLPLKGRFGVRVFELDYLVTHLPNIANDYQGDFRASTGITYRISK
jgi:hypothetical protein